MKVLFAGQVPKELQFPEDIEDALKMTADDSRLVISDGASESFDSKTWARLLVSSFVQCPELNESWLANAISRFAARFDFANLSWSKQAAFTRGSFATLLAVDQSTGPDNVNITSVGDSLAVFLDSGELLQSFPYVQAEEFQQRPQLLSTNTISNTFVTSQDFLANHQKTWSLQGRSDPVILCMTDALGAWALRHSQNGNPRWQQLAQIRDVTELESLVIQERDAKTLRVDDTTLVLLSFLERQQDELPES